MNDEIFDAIKTIHIAFRKVGLESPTALVVACSRPTQP